ncbi:hypothetical protein CLAFUR0_06569 [Fulvia fulva]|nr:hypothetical protein CLAFUR0_06569 [Fulvia fulva]
MDLLYTPPSALQLRILQALCESNPTSTLLTTTPIFKINALHFAAAALDTTLLIAMLEYINLSQITPTALGHTLLHLACLPLDDTFVNVFSQAIANSIHHVRTPSTDWQSEEIGFFRYVNQARENSEIANIEFSMNNRSAFFRPQSTESFSGSV